MTANPLFLFGAVAGLTAASAVVVAVRMYETLDRPIGFVS